MNSAAVIRHEDCYRHASQHRLHTDALGAALYEMFAEKIAPMRLAARRLRPGDLGSGPIWLSLAARGIARSRNDKRVFLMAAGKGADLVGSGAGSNERLVSPVLKQLRMIAAVCQQGHDDGQFDTAVAPISEHFGYRRAAVSFQ